jgi:gliding motility-associated-like protein
MDSCCHNTILAVSYYSLMLSRKIYILLCWLLPILSWSQAQLKLVLEPDNITYKVYLKSSKVYTGSSALITTSQITLVVPHGTGNARFIPENIISPSVNMRWRLTHRVDAPAENPDKDYLFFSFINNQTPLVLFDIQPNSEILLFSFTRRGNCSGLAYLVDDKKDAFLPPNSQNINIGINLTVVGAGGNAYTGTYDTLPQFNIVADKSNPCAGSKVNFKLESNQTILNAKYQWFVESLPQNGATTTNFSYDLPKKDSNFDLRVSVNIEIPNANICQKYTTRLQSVVNVKATPKVEWLNKPSGCLILPSKLSVSVTPFADITWKKDNLPIIGEKSSDFNVVSSGKYQVSAVINGCESTTEILEIVGGTTASTVTADAGKDTTVLEKELIQLNGKSNGGVRFSWTPKTDIKNDATLTPILSPSETTTYKLNVEDKNGCKASDEVMVTVIPKLYIPNAFTPNNDLSNDTWVIKNIEIYPESVIKVYNRWGNLVAELKDYKNDWKGTAQSGEKLMVGIYKYEITTRLKQYSGVLNIIY